MRNNSTLKNTKPGHAILNANNNNGRHAVNSQFNKWEVGRMCAQQRKGSGWPLDMVVKIFNCGATAGCIEIRVPRSKCQHSSLAFLDRDPPHGHCFLVSNVVSETASKLRCWAHILPTSRSSIVILVDSKLKKIAKNGGLRYFEFFRLKPAPGHGLS